MKFNSMTILALVGGGLLVYLLMSNKDSNPKSEIPKCKDDEELKYSTPNCLVGPCPPIPQCVKKLKI